MSSGIGQLVESLYMTGRWEDLEAECRSRLAGNPGDTETMYLLAETVLGLGRTPEASALLRTLAEGTGEARFHARLGWTLEEAGALDEALAAFRTAIASDRNFTAEAEHYEDLARCRDRLDDALARQPARRAPPANGIMVCHAHIAGFFSEVHDVLGYLLAAEIDGRRLHVQWGGTSLFSEGPHDNAFTRLFRMTDMASAEEVEAASRASVFPQPWAAGSVLRDDIWNKSRASKSVCAIDLMFREPAVVVGACYTGVHFVRHLLPVGDPRRSLATAAFQQSLFAQRLRPAPELAERAAAFVRSRFGDTPFLAVHVRGTDKQREQGGDLDIVNAAIWQATARKLARAPERPLYLMSDDTTVVARYRQTYGARVVVTDALRGEGPQGAVHITPTSPRRRIGEEMLVDALIAIQAAEFVGNRWSNVACGVRTMRTWAPGTLTLYGSDDASVNYHASFIRP